MSKRPRVRAMIVTNQNGAYAAIDTRSEKLKTIAEFSSSEVTRRMDRGTFRDFLKESASRGIYAVGKNTWADMGDVLRKKILAKAEAVLVSSGHEILSITQSGTRQIVEFDTECHFVKTGILAAEALDLSRQNDGCEITVLGGLSVYRAFSGMYTEVYQCRIHTKEIDNQLIAPDLDHIFLARRPLKPAEFETFFPSPSASDEDNDGVVGTVAFGGLWHSTGIGVDSREPFPVARINNSMDMFDGERITETALYRVIKFKRKSTDG